MPDLDEKQVKSLLAWATLLAFIALAVLGLDLMIKRQLLEQAKEADAKLRALKGETGGQRFGPAPGSAAQNGSRPGGHGRMHMAAVDDDPGAPAQVPDDAAGPADPAGVPEGGS